MLTFETRWYEYIVYGPWVAAVWLWDQKWAFLLGIVAGGVTVLVLH